jgi:hypothetical protein
MGPFLSLKAIVVSLQLLLDIIYKSKAVQALLTILKKSIDLEQFART